MTTEETWSRLIFDFYNSAFGGFPGGGMIPSVGINIARGTTPYTADYSPGGWRTHHDGSWWTIQGSRPPFREMLGWRVRFDAVRGYLEVNHLWYCDDKNPETPYVFPFLLFSPTRPFCVLMRYRILFNGTWAGFVDMECKFQPHWEEPDDVNIGCYIPNGTLTVKPQVTWQTLKNRADLPPY